MALKTTCKHSYLFSIYIIAIHNCNAYPQPNPTMHSSANLSHIPTEPPVITC